LDLFDCGQQTNAHTVRQGIEGRVVHLKQRKGAVPFVIDMIHVITPTTSI